ncbi:hypothetical protein [Mangrovicoccus ximenensis]|uniref:hypothetical protein n=1 Tax=Mangrovicoccus ximenensis TaxID=1911570 RepID=UPI000D3A2329|nr:hypothetical protein [Mangrovicoccus ximenensis]
MGCEGGYTAVTDFLRTVRPSVPKPFGRRFETPPGRQAQVDFGGLTAESTEGEEEKRSFRGRDRPTNGAVRKVRLFSMVLGHSPLPANACIRLPGNGRFRGGFVAGQNLQSVLRCHIDAIEGEPIRVNGPSGIGAPAGRPGKSPATG